MNARDTDKKIKERGYFEVIFEPRVYEENLICQRKLDCKKFVEDAQIRLRGWYYPHIPQETTENQGIYVFEKGVEAYIDYGMTKEVWRLYQSGQFVHRFSLVEDWLKEDTWFKRDDIQSGKYLDPIGVIYRFTEITEFLKQLFINIPALADGGRLSIKLANTQDRTLKILFDGMRVGLFNLYKTGIDPIEVSAEFTREEIINKSPEVALSLLTKLFDDFNWNNQPTDSFRKDQIKLLNRQL